MKSPIIFGVTLLLSTGLGLMLARATYASSTTASLLDRLFDEADLSSGDKDLEDLASSQDEPFQNLYLYMFSNVVNGPSNAAVDELVERLKNKHHYGYSKEELKAIVQDGSLEPIIEKQLALSEKASDPTNITQSEADQAAADTEFSSFLSSNDFAPEIDDYYKWYYQEYGQLDVLSSSDVQGDPTQSSILEEYTYLTNLYQNELALQRDYRKLAYESVAQEMFFNNDLSDSARIDILYDLDQLHLLLFGDEITYPDRSGDTPVSLSSAPELPGDFDSDAPDEGAVLLSEDASTEFTPYACFEDSDLQAALDVYESTPPTDDTDTGFNWGFDPSKIVYPGHLGSGSDSSEEATPSDDPVAATDDALSRLDGMINTLEGTKGDWTRALPCGEYFCVTVDLVTGHETPAQKDNYVETDNSIAAHIDYIYERMNDTLDYSLVAGKVPMNYMEDATCKEAGYIGLDFNVYTIKKPISLDAGDDIDATPEKDLETLKHALVDLGAYYYPGASKSIVGKTVSDLSCESILNLQDISGGDGTLESAQADCVTAAQTQDNLVQNAYEEMTVDASMTDLTTLYGQVFNELSSMASVFENFKEALEATYSTAQAPLTELLSKPYCSL